MKLENMFEVIFRRRSHCNNGIRANKPKLRNLPGLGFCLALTACATQPGIATKQAVSSTSVRAIAGGTLRMPIGLPNAGTPLLLEVFDATDRKTYFANLNVTYLEFLERLSFEPQGWRLDARWEDFYRPGHSYQFNVTAALQPYHLMLPDGNLRTYGVLTTAGYGGKAMDFNHANLLNRVNGSINKILSNSSMVNSVLENGSNPTGSGVVGGGLEQSWEVRHWFLLGETEEKSLFQPGHSSAENPDTDSNFFRVAFDPSQSGLPRLLGQFRLNTQEASLIYTPAPQVVQSNGGGEIKK